MVPAEMMSRTLSYYAENAEGFAAGTAEVDFSATCNRFLAHLPQGGKILDFGCGSGRDSRYFLERGYQVVAADGSKELCRIAEKALGIPVRNMLFSELAETETYDGIWACASILHLSRKELPEVIRRMSAALKKGGFLYASFKYGTFEGERNGRYFTDLTEETFNRLIAEFPELHLSEQWVSEDVRPGRASERWLNVILGK